MVTGGQREKLLVLLTSVKQLASLDLSLWHDYAIGICVVHVGSVG